VVEARRTGNGCCILVAGLFAFGIAIVGSVFCANQEPADCPSSIQWNRFGVQLRESIGRTELFQVNAFTDCRNSANHAPATNNRKPGLVPGFFVSAVSALDGRFTSESRHSGSIGRLAAYDPKRTSQIAPEYRVKLTNLPKLLA